MGYAICLLLLTGSPDWDIVGPATKETVNDFFEQRMKKWEAFHAERRVELNRELAVVMRAKVTGAARQEKADKIAELKNELAKFSGPITLEKEFPRLRANEVKAGQVGEIQASNRDVRSNNPAVLQIFDGRNCLVNVGQQDQVTLWVTGFDTKDLADNSPFALLGRCWEVTGKRTYEFARGGVATVFEIRPFDLDAARRAFLEAARKKPPK
jgi:hypothetical protein